MLFSSKALRFVVTASVASLIVAQEECTPKEYIAALHEGVDKVHIIDGTIERAVILEIFTDSGIGTEIMI